MTAIDTTVTGRTETGLDDDVELALLDQIRGVRDSLSVNRVFGDPYTLDGLTIVPVARVAGGAGGGGGGGTDDEERGGHGFGTGWGMGARPLGMYTIRDGQVSWKPAIDADRLSRGGQILTGILAVCLTLVLLRRR